MDTMTKDKNYLIGNTKLYSIAFTIPKDQLFFMQLGIYENSILDDTKWVPIKVLENGLCDCHAVKVNFVPFVLVAW